MVVGATRRRQQRELVGRMSFALPQSSIPKIEARLIQADNARLLQLGVFDPELAAVAQNHHPVVLDARGIDEGSHAEQREDVVFIALPDPDAISMISGGRFRRCETGVRRGVELVRQGH